MTLTPLQIGTCKFEPYVNHPRTTECVDFLPVTVRPLPDNLSHRVTPPAPAPAVKVLPLSIAMPLTETKYQDLLAATPPTNKVVSDQGFWGKLCNAIGEALFGGGR